jgi:broad specificity phosphatase PhoE
VPPTELLLIRHAESVWNAERRWQGRADPPLSERGVDQARRLGESLTTPTLDRVIASDLQRAFATASHVAAHHRLEPHPDPRLREHDVGRWEGRRRQEIEDFDAEALARFDAGEPNARAGGGESRIEVRQRVCAAMLEIAHESRGLRIAVVTHLGVIRSLVEGPDLENAGCRRLAGEEMERALRRWG